MKKLKLFIGFVILFFEKILNNLEHLFAFDKKRTGNLYLKVGNDYAENGEIIQAISSYEKALQFNNDDDESHFKLAVLYAKSNETDKAVELWKKVIELNLHGMESFGFKIYSNGKLFRVSESFFHLGSVCTKLGKIDEALSYYKKATELNPEIPEYHFRLGLIFDRKKMHEQAIPLYEKAISINPDVSKYYYSLGLSYDSKGLHDKAVEFFRKALELEEAENEI